MTHDPNKNSEIELEIGGISCAGCKNKIAQALQKAKGVQEASVNLVTHKALISYDPNQIGMKQIIRAVINSGCLSYRHIAG